MTTEKVREFLMPHLLTYKDGAKLDDDDNFFELGFVDSSLAMQLIAFVEKEFGIQVTDEDLDLTNFSTINRIVEFAAKKKGATEPAP